MTEQIEMRCPPEEDNWLSYADGKDKFGRVWFLQDRMHPTVPKIEYRAWLMVDDEWRNITPDEYHELECSSGETPSEGTSS